MIDDEPPFCQKFRLPPDAVIGLLRLTANRAEVWRRCPQPACRRGKACRAKDMSGDGPPCGLEWPDALVARLEGAADGLAYALVRWGVPRGG